MRAMRGLGIHERIFAIPRTSRVTAGCAGLENSLERTRAILAGAVMIHATTASGQALCEWASAVFEQCVVAGFVVPPWCIDDAMAVRLCGYFEVGLQPADAAQACFATHH
jgi:hypothetical protein